MKLFISIDISSSVFWFWIQKRNNFSFHCFKWLWQTGDRNDESPFAWYHWRSGEPECSPPTRRAKRMFSLWVSKFMDFRKLGSAHLSAMVVKVSFQISWRGSTMDTLSVQGQSNVDWNCRKTLISERSVEGSGLGVCGVDWFFSATMASTWWPFQWRFWIGAFENEEEFVNGSLDVLRYKWKIQRMRRSLSTDLPWWTKFRN